MDKETDKETDKEWLERMRQNSAKYGTVDAEDLERLIKIAEQWMKINA